MDLFTKSGALFFNSQHTIAHMYDFYCFIVLNIYLSYFRFNENNERTPVHCTIYNLCNQNLPTNTPNTLNPIRLFRRSLLFSILIFISGLLEHPWCASPRSRSHSPYLYISFCPCRFSTFNYTCKSANSNNNKIKTMIKHTLNSENLKSQSICTAFEPN